MSSRLDHFLELYKLEPIEENIFRGQSDDPGWGTLYGGHVLGQALAAAAKTVAPDRLVHSLHGYFLRPGDVTRPIVYEVDRIRDGGSFTTRLVVAVQKGQAILNLSASFQKTEPGFDHQFPMPDAPPPETLLSEEQRLQAFAHLLPPTLTRRPFPFDLRPVDPVSDPFHPPPAKPRRMVWMRANGKLPDDEALHRYLLTYISDYGFLATALLPHGITWLSKELQVVSLDHAVWFHQPLRVDEWLLHVMESPKSHGSRGLVRGDFYTRDGRLVASTAQEGLIRKKTAK